MISAQGLAKSFGDRTLFADAAFRLVAGERYGLVGANGSGKSTLLDILAGRCEPSAGSVSTPGGVRLGVLGQRRFLQDADAVLSVALKGNAELWRAMAAKDAMLDGPEDAFDADEFSRLEEVVQRHDGYAAEAAAAAILEGLGIPAETHDRPLSMLSGGYKLRVCLAQVLAGAPDALLLDEPTNHLDVLSIRWLEKFLQAFPGPVVVVSHDHRFLDNVATHVLDVDYETVLAYPGNYTRFAKAKQAERERREREIESRRREIARHQQFVDRFRAKATKARQAQSKLRLIEKQAEGLQELPRSSRRRPVFRFEQARPSGREALKVEGVSKSYGNNRVLSGVSLRVNRGDRLAILGPNGIGKSTLLKILAGDLRADSGAVEWGRQAQPGYFAQDHARHFDSPNQSAEAWLEEGCGARGAAGGVRGQMGKALFTGDDAAKRVGDLSGGEAARLVFCRLAIQRPNVLLLDEPTNHLDLESIEALVEGLRSYEGTLVFVSHDRWLVSRLADRIVEISTERIRDFRGSYDDYVQDCGDDRLDVVKAVPKTRAKTARNGSSASTGAGAGRREEAGSAARRAAGRRRGDRGATPFRRAAEDRQERILARMDAAEGRVAEIDAVFARSSYFAEAEPSEVQDLKAQRAVLVGEIEGLAGEWNEAERALAALCDTDED